MSQGERAERLAQVWLRTLKDYRSIRGKTRYILIYRPEYGTCLVPLSDLTDAEIAHKLGEGNLSHPWAPRRS